MPNKAELTARERKHETSKKKKELFGKYSNKHIRNQEKLIKNKVNNNSTK